MLWDSLFANIAIIALVLVIWQTIAEGIDISGPRTTGIVIGTLMGFAGCLSILTGKEILPGVLIDLRTATVASAAFFGGPIGALIAGGLTGALRTYIGGDGSLPAIVAITSSAIAGLILRRLFDGVTITRWQTVTLSLSVSVCYGSAYLFIPYEIMAVVFAKTFLPMFLLNFITTFCIASLSSKEIRRQDLVRTNAIYRQIVEFMPDPLVAKDAKGRVIAANPASAELLGVADEADLLGKTNPDLLPAEAARRATREEEVVLKTGEMLKVERKFSDRDVQARWISIQKVPLRDSSGDTIGVVVHGRDVSEQRRLLEMKSEFISLVSHELRTPLTSVRGSLGLLKGSLPETFPEGLRNLLEIAQRNSERLVRLINDILDVEKIEDGSLEFRIAPHALGPLIRETLPSFEKYMPDQRISVRFEDNAPDTIADVDVGRFEQVLSNLVSNAIKFSPPGGTVTIALNPAPQAVVLSVRDYGSGISEGFRARIFERFEQSDASDTRSKGGTGLGLHIAKVFVEKMGGKIKFESTEGEGTTFFVAFPAKNLGAQAQKAVPLLKGFKAATSKPRLMYLEDDTSLGMMVKELLGAEAEVDHVTSLEAARALLATETYDLLLIDDELPDGSGMSLLDDGLSLPPVIVFTAREVRSETDAVVLHRFIKTRVEEQTVIDAIRGALGHQKAA